MGFFKGKSDKPCHSKPCINAGSESHLFAVIPLLSFLVWDYVFIIFSICCLFPGSCGLLWLLLNIHIAILALCCVSAFSFYKLFLVFNMLHILFNISLSNRCVRHIFCLNVSASFAAKEITCFWLPIHKDLYFSQIENIFFLSVVSCSRYTQRECSAAYSIFLDAKSTGILGEWRQIWKDKCYGNTSWPDCIFQSGVQSDL